MSFIIIACVKAAWLVVQVLILSDTKFKVMLTLLKKHFQKKNLKFLLGLDLKFDTKIHSNTHPPQTFLHEGKR